MKPFDAAWLVLKNFVFEPGKGVGYFDPETGETKLNLSHPYWSAFHTDSDDGPSNIDAYAESRLNPVLEHEETHRLIDGELKDAVKEGILPRDRYRSAHEIGAYALSQSRFGDPYQATRHASKLTGGHRNVKQHFPEGTTPYAGVDGTGSFQPKPIVSDDLPYDFPERYPGQARWLEDFE